MLEFAGKHARQNHGQDFFFFWNLCCPDHFFFSWLFFIRYAESL